jgi:hypothetical protein
MTSVLGHILPTPGHHSVGSVLKIIDLTCVKRKCNFINT